MATIILSIGILVVAVALLALRILLVPGGELRGTCASNNPFLRSDAGECWACGKRDAGEIDGCEYRDAKTVSLLWRSLKRTR